jgi:dimethylargininase
VRFAHAITRPPGSTFAGGITTSAQRPDLALALAQHAHYCDALRAAGLELTLLPPDDLHPDSTFVEDTAVVSGERAIIARPGAASRLGEAASMRDVLATRFATLDAIEAPGTLDGGDVCEAGASVYIGLSHRTNRSGAEQLAAWFARDGKRCEIVDIRGLPGILHLKTGLSYVGDGVFVAMRELAAAIGLPASGTVEPAENERYGANCVRVNDVVLLPSETPQLCDALERHGLRVVPLHVSEYRKMDGGLSCLSIRF